MKNKTSLVILFFLLIGSIFFGGCSSSDLNNLNLNTNDLKNASNLLVKCEAPYIRNGMGCCLDKNKNKICDKDESNTIKTNTTNTTNLNKSYQDVKDKFVKTNVGKITSNLFKNVDLNLVNESNIDEVIRNNTNLSIDSDGDGIPDKVETSGELGYVTDPNNPDTDGDGLSDLREYWWLCDPTNSDTNGDFISDGDSVNLRKALPYKIDVGSDTVLGTSDMDGDLLPNAVEIYELNLNPKLYSSDGDRYGDGQEFFRLDSTTDSSRFPLPSYVKADPYNPATPDIAVKVKPNVELIYDKTYIEGGEKRKESVVRKSTTNSFQETVGLTVGTRVSTTISISSNPLNMETGGKFEAYAGLESQTSYTFNGEKFKSHENSNEDYSRLETDYSNTKLRMNLEVENIGTDILTSTLNEITVNYYLGRDKQPFATQELSTSITNLKPGDVVSITQTDVPLSFDDFMRVLNGEGITVRLAHFSFGEDQVYLENSKASGIRVMVDDDKGIKEDFIIPTGNNYTIKDVLNRLHYNYTFKDNRLVSFNGIGDVLTKPYKTWSLLITRYNTDKIKIAKKIEDTKLKPGDELVIKYRVDHDGDGLSDEEELMLGTNISNIDTDGDNLTDGYTYTDLNNITHIGELSVGSNPLLPDTDFDYVPDYLEYKYNTSPTDPNSYPNFAMVYDLENFKGKSMRIIGEKDLTNVFNDKISSMIIPKGLAVILYENEDQSGDNSIYFGKVNKLDILNNKASYIKVVKIKDLPPFELIIKKKYPNNLRFKPEDPYDNSCLFLNTNYKEQIQAENYNCFIFDGNKISKYHFQINIGGSSINQDAYPSSKDYITWKLSPSNGNWLHLINIGSSKDKNKNICLYANSSNVGASDCNNLNLDSYMNWKIIPSDGGWAYILNNGSSTSDNICLGMNIFATTTKDDIKTYNCNTDDQDSIKWRLKEI